MFIPNVGCNKNNYGSLIARGAISVQDVNGFDLEYPRLDDFLRMVAQDQTWGNEGSL